MNVLMHVTVDSTTTVKVFNLKDVFQQQRFILCLSKLNAHHRRRRVVPLNVITILLFMTRISRISILPEDSGTLEGLVVAQQCSLQCVWVLAQTT